MTAAIDFRGFYSQPGVLTDPGRNAPLFAGLPDGIPALCEIVQGLILHMHWAEQYGAHLSQERRNEANLRTVSRQLDRLLQMDASPLTVKRPKEKRVVGTCRDFSTFLTAILRYKGIPARARCGFGTYFMPGRGEDHWVCEYWREDQNRWVMVDAQLDPFQLSAIKANFDSRDMPPGRFLIAGEAWQKCRRGLANPEIFGIFEMHGMWFIAGNLLRDLLSLNKVELLPWDVWPAWPDLGPGLPFTPEVASWLDRVAETTLAGNEAFTRVRSIYQQDNRLRDPPGWPAGKFGFDGAAS